MQYINVLDSMTPEILYDYLSNRISETNITRNGVWTTCRLNDSELTREKFVALITEYVWEILLPRVVSNYLKRVDNVEPDDMFSILSRTMHIAYGLRAAGDVVHDKFSVYIKPDVRNLSIDGFLRFRLKELCLDMEALTKLCVDESCAQYEFDEFVHLIRDVVESQQPIYDEIHLIEENDRIKIYFCGTDITEECIDTYVNNSTDKNVTYHDCVVSSIISIAPKKIFVHCGSDIFDTPFLETIKGIFAGRVIMC